MTSNYISASDVVATVDTTLNSKVLFLPGVSSIYGKILTVKDITGNASSNTITLRTALFDKFENNSNQYIINNAFGSLQLLAKSNYWYILNTATGGGGSDTTGGSNPGVSSLSSIVSYGLSSVYGGHGISSLSSIVAYGLSSVNGGAGISSLSSIVAYGLSSVNGGRGISSLSSIVSYGLSSVNAGRGISSLSSIVAYGLSSVNAGRGVSSLSSIVSYGLSSVNGGRGISSLSSIVSYGLSSVNGGRGISSLSSIVAYGLSSVNAGRGVSSLSSIVSYGLSSIQNGLSSISSLKITTSSLHSLYISSGIADFSTISTQTILVGYVGSPLQVNIGIETPIIYSSNIESYRGYFTGNLGIGRKAPYWYALDVLGDSRFTGNVRFTGKLYGDGSELQNLNVSNVRVFTPGVSSLSSIVAYGLSSVRGSGGNSSNPGVSSLSSIIAYGLSTVNGGRGISSLSSIVAYGLSSVNGGHGLSSLSSIVAYGLSSVNGSVGVSSLSSIVAYGLSTVGLIQTPTVGAFINESRGGTGISSLASSPKPPDTITDAVAKIDHWLFSNIIAQPPAPNVTSSDIVGTSIQFKITPPFQIKSGVLNQWLPAIYSLTTNIYLSNGPLISSIVLTSNEYLPKGLSNLQGIYIDAKLIPTCNITFFGYGATVSTSNLLYIPLSNLINESNYIVNMFYSNYSVETPNETNYNWYINRGGYAGAPFNLVLSNPTYNSIYTSFNLSYLDETEISRTVDQNGYNEYANIRLFNSNIDALPRRYNLGFVSYSNNTNNSIPANADSNSNLSYNISNLPPDTTLYFNVAIQNNFRSLVSPYVSSNSTNNRTLLPPTTSNLTFVTYNSVNIGVYPVRGLSNNNGIITSTSPLTIYSNAIINAYGGFSNILNNSGAIAIHTSNSPGASNRIISYLQVVSGADTNTFSFMGWSNILQDPLSCNSQFSRINVGAIQDTYVGNTYSSNFYLQASNVTVVISNTFFPPGQDGKSFSITHSNLLDNVNITCNSPTYYSDNYVGTPSLNLYSNYRNISNDITNPYQFVSGVLSYTSNVVFDFNVDVNNWASNFFPACNSFLTVSYTNAGASTCNISSNTTVYTNTNGTFSANTNPARFKLSNTQFNTSATFLTNSISDQITANVTVNTLMGSTTFSGCNLPYYFDIASVLAIRNIFSNVYASGGARYSVSNILYPTSIQLLTFTEYNHSNPILSGSPTTLTPNNYNSELPFINGLFLTASNLTSSLYTNYYRNLASFTSPFGFNYTYPNYNFLYSGVETTNANTRFAMFKYSFSNSLQSNVKLIQFNVYFTNGWATQTPNNLFNNSVKQLIYKIDNVGQYNTNWLNGNAIKETNDPPYSLVDGSPGLRGSNILNTPILNNTNRTRYFSINPIPSGCNYDLYIRVGLATNSNINFNYINPIPIHGSNPTMPTNIRLSNTPTTVLNTNWINPTNFDFPLPPSGTGAAPILSNILTYTAITGPSGPRRWVTVGVNTYCNDVVTIYNLTTGGTTTNYATPSNADTYYNVTIQSVNDVGSGTTSGAITSSNPTPLPPTYGSFNTNGNVFGIVSRYLSNYPTTQNIYVMGTTRTTITNVNLINWNQAFQSVPNAPFTNAIQLQISNAATLTQFTVNNETATLGSNLSNVVLYTTLSNGARLDTSRYTFTTNTVYEQAAQSNIGSNGSAGCLYLSNAIDRYYGVTSNNYAGFFYTAAFTYIASNTYVTPSNIPYRFTMSNHLGSNISSPNYYFDDLTASATATINNIFVDTAALDSSYYTYVSGLAVFKTTCNYNFWIVASNLGSYFYVNTPVSVSLRDNVNSLTISNYSFNPTTTKFYSTSNLAPGNELTTNIKNANNQTYLYWSNVALSNSTYNRPIFTVLNPISNVGVASNLNTTSASIPYNIVFSDFSDKPFYFDSASVLLRDATKNSNSIPGFGYRVESGTGSNPDWFSACNVAIQNFGKLYEDSSNISTSYSNELQLVNGVYTASNTLAYLNYSPYYAPTGYSYPNYTSIYTDGRIRYTTFMWYIGVNPSIKNFAYFKITSNNFPNTNIAGFNTYTGGITIQYRIIGSTYPSSSTGNTSAWLNGNTFNTGNSSYINFTSLYNAAGGTTGQNITPFGTINTDQFNRLIIVSDSYGNRLGTGLFNLYIRIGLPINSNYSFSNINLLAVQ